MSIGGSVAGTGLLTGSNSARAGVSGDCNETTTMYEGDRYTMRVTDDVDGNLGYTLHVDNNWMISLVAEDNDSYTFAVSGIFHTYEDDGSSARAFETQKQVKLDAEIDNYSDTNNTYLKENTDPEDGEPFSSLEALYGTNWAQWKDTYKGQTASESEVKQKLKNQNYDDPDVPYWVDAAAFVGGVAASGFLSGGLSLVVGGTSTAVSGISIADKVADKAEDSCNAYTNNPDDNYYRWWDYCGDMALTSHASQFSVNVGDESGPVTLRVYQSFEPDSDYDSYTGADNVGYWKIKLPNGSENPTICYRGTSYDSNGHSHPTD